MSRLPSRLQPAWPLVKRAHRALSLVLGLIFRRTSRVCAGRRLPPTATTQSSETARLEPAHVVRYPAGAAERLRRRVPSGEPPGHWVFEREATYDVPPRFVLEIQDGTTVGEYAATITPGGRLDFETSRYFGVTRWREHPLFLRPWLPSPTPVAGTLLDLTSPGATSNYYHFVMDVLPRYGIARSALPDLRPDLVHVPHQLGYQKQLLALTGIDRHRLVQPHHRQALRAETLVVPSHPNDELAAPRWVVDWLRDHLRATPHAQAAPRRRLYVTRGDRPRTRRYVQEPDLWPELERRGFERLDPGTLTVQEQIDRFASAQLVVGPHGAALTNLVFAQPGTAVVELFAPSYVNHCYWTIAEALDGIDYHYLVGDGRHRAGRPMTGVLTDVELPARRVLRTVDRLL